MVVASSWRNTLRYFRLTSCELYERKPGKNNEACEDTSVSAASAAVRTVIKTPLLSAVFIGFAAGFSLWESSAHRRWAQQSEYGTVTRLQ
jgi:hypothetical protein